MAEKSKIGRKKSGSERDLGASNGKPALLTKPQLARAGVGGAPLPSQPMMLSAASDRIMHSLRVLDILERIDLDLGARPKAPAQRTAQATDINSDSLQRRAS
jgi:hypothetical protein